MTWAPELKSKIDIENEKNRTAAVQASYRWTGWKTSLDAITLEGAPLFAFVTVRKLTVE